MQKNPVFFLLFCLSILAGCSHDPAMRGNYVLSDKIEKAKGASKDDVARLLGSPSHIVPYDPNVWIYAGFKEEKFAFFDAKETDRQVVRVAFDQNGRNAKIKVLTKKDGKNVSFYRDKTKTEGNDQDYVDQIIKNIGRFRLPDQQ